MYKDIFFPPFLASFVVLIRGASGCICYTGLLNIQCQCRDGSFEDDAVWIVVGVVAKTHLLPNGRYWIYRDV